MSSTAWAPSRSLVWLAALLVLPFATHATDSSSLHVKTEPHTLTDGIKYVTRPDIEAPRWNITVYDEANYTPGYWFVATYDYLDQTHGIGGWWNAPHIFDNYGELVWSGSYISQKYDSFDFKLSNVMGEAMLTWLYPRNRSVMVLDDHFMPRMSFKASNSFTEKDNMHDLRFVDNGTSALYFYGKYTDLVWQGKKCRVEDCCFRDRNMLNDHVDFEWCASSHVDLEESTYGTPEHQCSNPRSNWDFVHANALDKFPEPDNSYLMSARFTDALYKIAPNGSVLWRLGGPYSDFEADFDFQRQHHARIHSHNDTHTVISVFDNAMSEDTQNGTSRYSRGLFFVLNTSVQPMTATVLAEYPHPWGAGHYTLGRGSTQLLSNGNVFQCWVDSCLHSEHTADGKLVMEGRVKQEWLKSYRSYKFDFVGHPTLPPDIYSTVEMYYGKTSTVAYASWNGATEVASWKLWSIDPDSTQRKLLTEVRRTGFETRLEYDGFAKHVQVEAYDKTHKFLGWSQIFATRNDTFEDTKDNTTENSTSDHTVPLVHPSGGHPSSWNAKFGSTAATKTFIAIAVVFIVLGVVIIIVGRKCLVEKETEHHHHESSNGFLRRMKNRSDEIRDDEDDVEREFFIPVAEKP